MTVINVANDVLQVRFTMFEKIAGLIRDVDVPLAAVRNVEVCPDGINAARGIRAPGLGLPGFRKIGTWRAPGSNTLVSVRRGQPALRIELAGHRRDGPVLGTDDAEQWARRLGALKMPS